MENKYNNGSIILHWIQGALILFIMITGSLVLSEMPSGAEKINSYKIHMIVGLVIFALTALRVIALRVSKPDALKVGSLREKAISINHFLIYAVIIAMALSGIVLSKVSGLSEIVFFGSSMPIPENLKEFTPSLVHSVLAKALVFLTAMHIVGVFSYMLKTKENVLSRMWFGKKVL